MSRGRTSDALAVFMRAKRVDHVSALFAAWTAYALFLLGRHDEALRETDRSFQLDSTLLAATNIGALVNLATGNKARARQLMERPAAAGAMSNAPCIFAAVGDTARASRLLRDIESLNARPWFSEAARACVMLARSDTAAALLALEQSSARVGSFWADYYPSLSDPAFDGIRGSARFAALLRKSAMPVALFTEPHGGRAR